MTINQPCLITARLLPGIHVGGAFISIRYHHSDSDGRTVYQWFIDMPDGTEYEGTDLRSGCQGGSLQSGMESLLGFLSAAGESYRYVTFHLKREIEEDDNASLFPRAVAEWAYQYSDELSMLEMELDENPNIIIE